MLSRTISSTVKSWKRYSTASTKQIIDSLRSARTSFQDRNDLHSRIDWALTCQNVRIAIVPLNCHRTEITKVTEELIKPKDDAVEDYRNFQLWLQKSFRNRLLTKDTLLKYGLDNGGVVVNHNSLTEHVIPLSVEHRDKDLPEFLEVNSMKDSWDHLKSSHLHVLVATHIRDAILPIKSNYPYIIVLDLPSTSAGAEEKELIARSVGSYVKVISTDSEENSNIESLKNQVFDTVGSEKRFLNSIIQTCQEDVDNFSMMSSEKVEELKRLRQNWSRKAHEELQTVLNYELDRLRYKTIPWYKLYYKVDDVYDCVSSVIKSNFLIHANNNLHYLLGRIDAADQATETSFLNNTAIDDARTKILSSEAVELHNSGLKQLSLILFGFQLPLAVCPLLCTYFFDVTLYSMGSIVAVGMVIGFRRLQQNWSRMTANFKNRVLEDARLAVNDTEKQMWKRVEHKFDQQNTVVKKKQEIIEAFKHHVNKLYN